MTKIVGIDFGTTNSLTAYAQNGKVRIIQSKDIEHILPSVICKYDGKLIVGKEAKENLSAFSRGDGIKEIKRHIGKNQKIKFAGQLMHPYEIAAIILRKIKRNLQIYFNEEITDVVITVPAQFSDAQRKEIMQAGEAAGFNVRKIINEPTAALLAYSSENNITQENVLCFDYGGGTFDVSIGEISSGINGRQEVKILATGGNRELGGSNIDRLLFDIVNHDLKQTKGISFDGSKMNLDFGAIQIFAAVEALKIDLSSKSEASISIPALRLPNGRTTGYFKKMTRNEFEALIMSEINNTIQIAKNVAIDSGISLSRIDKVLLVGGSSRIPLVKKQIESKLGITATYGNINSAECVAIGAGIEAANLSGTRLNKKINITRDVCPFTLGLKYGDGVSNDLFDPLITKNFPYGEEFSEEYATALDYQNTMELEIYQGESSRASQNEKVCDFIVRNIPERMAGKEKVRIAFKYNTDGILTIRAKILSTGVEVTHTHKYGYSVEASRTTRHKVESHFIEDEKVEEAIALVKSLKKYSAPKDEKRIIEAIKYEDKDELDDIMADLLD